MMRKPLSYSLKVSRSGSFLHPTLTASIHPCDTLEFMCTSSLIVYPLSVASGLEGARGSIGCLTYSLRFLKPAANKPLTIDPLTPPAGADRSAPPSCDRLTQHSREVLFSPGRLPLPAQPLVTEVNHRHGQRTKREGGGPGGGRWVGEEMWIDVRRGHEIDEAMQQLCGSCAHTLR